MLCLLGFSFLPNDSFERQLLEPQIFVLSYLGWLIWVAITVLWHQPFKTVETLELDIRRLPRLEEIAKPFLRVEDGSSDAEKQPPQNSEADRRDKNHLGEKPDHN